MNLIFHVGSFFPGMLISLVFGSISDKVGRKPILLLALAFVSFQFLGYIAEFTFLDMSVLWLTLILSFTGIGAISLSSAQSFSYCIFAEMIENVE